MMFDPGTEHEARPQCFDQVAFFPLVPNLIHVKFNLDCGSNGPKPTCGM